MVSQQPVIIQIEYSKYRKQFFIFCQRPTYLIKVYMKSKLSFHVLFERTVEMITAQSIYTFFISFFVLETFRFVWYT